MPRCYMVKKCIQRHDGPPPCSPSEASVAPPCYSPKEHAAVTDTRAAEYAQVGSLSVSERSAADTEAAHELLSLAHSLPPPPPAPPAPPAPLITVFSPEPAPLLPLYTYTLQPTNIYILAEEAEPVYHAVQTVTPLQTVESQVNYLANRSSPPPPPSALPAEHHPHPQPESQEFTDGLFDSSSIAKEKQAKYDCGECGKRYATSSNLSRHKQTHRSLDSMAAKRCGECGKAYVSMPALAMHVLTHRMGHVCGVCGKKFSRPWLLRGHVRSHTGEKPYICDTCGKAFADRSNLRAHLHTHSSDKKFKCSRCQKTFALKSYLNKHRESACMRPDDE